MPAIIPNLPERLAGEPGVKMTPPPEQYMGATTSIIRDAIKQIPEGKNAMVTVWVRTSDGINVAYAQKFGDNVQVTGWVGGKWGKPLEAGVVGQVTW